MGLDPAVVYNGGYSDATEIKLRIANGGAGQSGLIGAWADAFIQYSVETLSYEPFEVNTASVALGIFNESFVGRLVPWRHYTESCVSRERFSGHCRHVQRGG